MFVKHFPYSLRTGLIQKKSPMKKFYLFVIIFSTFVSALSFGQISPWQHLYGDTTYVNGLPVGHSIRLTSDGGYLLGGGTTTTGILFKINSTGALQWGAKYNTTHEFTTAIPADDGGYAAAGLYSTAGVSVPCIVKTSANGDVQWAKSYSFPKNTTVASLRQTADHGYILSGGYYLDSINKSQFLLIKTDANGNLQWSKNYGTNYQEYAVCALEISNGFMIAGTLQNDAYNWDIVLIRTDAAGTIDWVKQYATADFECPKSLIATSDGGFAMTGGEGILGNHVNAMIMKVDSGGGILWSNSFGNGTAVYYGQSLVENADQTFTVAGEIDTTFSGERDPLLFKVDNQGNLLWNKVYGGNGSGLLGGESFCKSGDQGYALLSTAFLIFTNKAYDFYVIKTNEVGNSVNCFTFNSSFDTQFAGFGSSSYSLATATGGTQNTLSITKTPFGLDSALCNVVGIDELQNMAHLEIYPNPAHTSFHVRAGGLYLDGQLIFRNAIGEVLWTKSVSGLEFSLEAGVLPAGMYYLQFINERESTVQELLLAR